MSGCVSAQCAQECDLGTRAQAGAAPGHLPDCRVTDRGGWPGCLRALLGGGREAELQSLLLSHQVVSDSFAIP